MKMQSITRKLITLVLCVEALGSLSLIAVVAVHERNVQLNALDAVLRGEANVLMGAVQDAEDVGDNVMLDLSSMHIDKKALYRVTDEKGRILGSQRLLPNSLEDGVHRIKVGGHFYRVIVLHGVRIVDPGKHGGVRRVVKIIYGMPDKHVWHKVMEVIRFVAAVSLLLFCVTGIMMIWIIRHSLKPVSSIAARAQSVNAQNWNFTAPEEARHTVELVPLVTALEAAMKRLQESFQQQQRFTNDAAHELKTDIAIVKSSLQLLGMKQRTPEEYEHGLRLTLNDFSRLENMVQRMLILARLEQTPASTMETCDLHAVLLDVIEQCRPIAELQQQSILCEGSPECMVPFDPKDASLLCSNILMNAIQHSPAGASIEIHLLRLPNEVFLSMRDHGPGIREDEKELLFDTFYRGDPSRSRTSGGTGLGLSICKAICKQVGGTICISNHPDGGSLLDVHIPLPLA